MSEKCNVVLEVKQYDCMLNQETILYSGAASFLLEDDKMQIEYVESNLDENKKQVKVIACYKDGIFTLNRIQESSSSFVQLIVLKKTQITVRSEYGDLCMQAYTHDLQIRDKEWIVEYDVLSDKEVVSSFRISFQIQNKLN